MTNYSDGKQISGYHGTGTGDSTGEFLCSDGTVMYLDTWINSIELYTHTTTREHI